MPKRLHKRRGADADLVSIWRFIAADSFNAANAILESIGNAFTLLIENPLAGRDRSELKPGLRSFVTGNYVIFYYARPNTIEIVRVLSGRQQVTRKSIS